jgi:AcrR family transcriptional regulator
MKVQKRTKSLVRGRPRGPGRLTATETAELNDRLLDAAFALFSMEGYGRTTMERIAREAGASTKTLYSRYANKSEMLTAVIDRIIRRSLAQHAAETSVDPGDVEPQRFLTSFAREVIARTEGEGLGLNRLVFAEGYRYPEVARFFAHHAEPGIQLMRRALEKWHAEGLLPLLDDPQMGAILLFTLMADRPRLHAIVGDPLSRKDLDAHVNAAVNLFLRGCGYAPALPKHRLIARGRSQ